MTRSFVYVVCCVLTEFCSCWPAARVDFASAALLQQSRTDARVAAGFVMTRLQSLFFCSRPGCALISCSFHVHANIS